MPAKLMCRSGSGYQLCEGAPALKRVESLLDSHPLFHAFTEATNKVAKGELRGSRGT